ncbi:Retrovirus-related Pol polyprotein from transposon 17.6, partial [Mucuna pruriens]
MKSPKKITSLCHSFYQMLEKLAEQEYYYCLDGPRSRKKLPSPADTRHLHLKGYPLVYATLLPPFREICIDDFFVFGPSFDKCLCNMNLVLKICRDTNLVLNWGKCQFMVLECMCRTQSNLERDRGRPRKVEVITKLPPLVQLKRFVKDFSKIAKPMTNLLAKDMEFEFSYACFKAFELLKEKLTSAPMVATLGSTSSFELMYDASDTIVGAMLGQRKDKMFHTIYYFSHTLNESQQNYTTREKELLAIVFAFDKFKHYLVLLEAIVYIGHFGIKFLLENQDTKPFLTRWILLLQEFDLEMRDKKWTKNRWQTACVTETRASCKL